MLALLSLAATASAADDVEVLRAGAFKLASSDPFDLPADQASPPPTDDAGFEPVALPDFWRTSRPGVNGLGWYRFSLPTVGQAIDTRWGVLLPRVDSNAAVFLNGRWLGEGGSFATPGDRGWNRPLYFPFPSSELKGAGNTLDVLVQTHGGQFSGLDPPELGPHSRLASRYARLFELRIGVARTSTLLGIVTLILFGSIWLAKGRDPVYGYFALAATCWTVNSLNYHVQQVPLPYWEWKALSHASLDGFAIFFVLSVSRLVGLRQPRFERALLGFGALTVAVATLAPWDWLDFAMRLTHAVSLGLALYCVSLIWRRRRLLARSELGMYLGTGTLFLVVVIHDYLLQVGLLPGNQPRLMQLAGLLVFAGFAGALLLRFIGEYRRSENTNVELEERVQQKHAELQQQFTRLRELEEQRAVGAERERIMREMHDGMGAQLVSTLALVEGEQPKEEEIARALREALEEMRLVIDSLDPILDDIPSILAALRSRLEPRLRRAGLRFDWQVTDLRSHPVLGADALLDVLRIVQEAVTNVLKHANAQVITIRTAIEPGRDGSPRCVVEVCDDGENAAGLDENKGRGLSNMQRRAARLGGELDIECHAAGTLVKLWLPLSPSSRSGPG